MPSAVTFDQRAILPNTFSEISPRVNFMFKNVNFPRIGVGVVKGAAEEREINNKQINKQKLQDHKFAPGLGTFFKSCPKADRLKLTPS